MKASSWLGFTLLRLAAFFVPLAVLLLVGINPWLSALLAAVIGLCVSYIFFRRPREQVATAIYDRRHPAAPIVNVDDEVEDAAIDQFEAGTPAGSEGEGRTETDAHDQPGETGQLEGEHKLR